MKRTIALVFALAAAQVFAATERVALVYNRSTEVTRETYKFLRVRLGYELVAVQVGTNVNLADYHGIIVLNVSVPSGVDPALAAFIRSFPQKDKIVVVSLYTRTDSTVVTVTTAAQSELGVDAVTAASLWSERRGSNTVLAMHEEWVRRVETLLEGR